MAESRLVKLQLLGLVTHAKRRRTYQARWRSKWTGGRRDWGTFGPTRSSHSGFSISHVPH